jgi:hypothetical protein
VDLFVKDSNRKQTFIDKTISIPAFVYKPLLLLSATEEQRIVGIGAGITKASDYLYSLVVFKFKELPGLYALMFKSTWDFYYRLFRHETPLIVLGKRTILRNIKCHPDQKEKAFQKLLLSAANEVSSNRTVLPYLGCLLKSLGLIGSLEGGYLKDGLPRFPEKRILAKLL